jgi:hypothetical protein
MQEASPVALLPCAKKLYAQRSTNTLQLVFRHHFPEFAELYDQRYAKDFGLFRLPRITPVAQKFLCCGDYTQGVARIQCTNPECRFEFFRPFSCKGFYLCPSCSQKRTLLFAVYLDQQLSLTLPHRQFVFSIPKALRVFFRHDQRLFAEVSSLIFSLITDFYQAAARILGLIVQPFARVYGNSDAKLGRASCGTAPARPREACPLTSSV